MSDAFAIFDATLLGSIPEATVALGVRVDAMRYGALILSGALCGLTGAQLSLGNVTLFVA